MRSNNLLSRSYSRPRPRLRTDTLDSVDEDAAVEATSLLTGELDPDLVLPSQPSSATRPSFEFDPAFAGRLAEEQHENTTSSRKLKINGSDWVLEHDEARQQVQGDRLSDYQVTVR